MPLQWLVFTDMRKATVGHPHRLHCQGRKGAGPSPTADGHLLTRLFLGHPLVPVPSFPRVTHLPDLEQWELTGCFYQPGSHRAITSFGQEMKVRASLPARLCANGSIKHYLVTTWLCFPVFFLNT